MYLKIFDCVKLMPPSNGMNYAAIARDALSGYPEVKTFAQPTSEGIAKFLRVPDFVNIYYWLFPRYCPHISEREHEHFPFLQVRVSV